MEPAKRSAARGPGRRALRALRGNTMGVVVMLVLQYSLGMWVNLEATVPPADASAGFWGAFVGAITNGPLALTLHALLGTLLLVSATVLVVRALRIQQPLWIALAVIGLLSIVFAWITGVRFTATGATTSSLFMALLTAFALLCYAVILFTSSISVPQPSNEPFQSTRISQ
jgi:drug/metabolite transporter (DMT)-like permease